MIHIKSRNEFLNESPDWSNGIEFGKQRGDHTEYFRLHPGGITPSKQKKIDKLNKKADIILKKWKDDSSVQFTVRKHVMSKNTQVGAKEALQLIDTAKSNVERFGETRGIIVYVS